MQLYHPCLSQVRVTLQGPGSLSGSPNFHSPAYEHEVVLFSELTTNGTGCLGGVHTFQFDDDSTRRPEDYNRVYEGVYQPQVSVKCDVFALSSRIFFLNILDLHSSPMNYTFQHFVRFILNPYSGSTV